MLEETPGMQVHRCKTVRTEQAVSHLQAEEREPWRNHTCQHLDSGLLASITEKINFRCAGCGLCYGSTKGLRGTTLQCPPPPLFCSTLPIHSLPPPPGYFLFTPSSTRREPWGPEIRGNVDCWPRTMQFCFPYCTYQKPCHTRGIRTLLGTERNDVPLSPFMAAKSPRWTSLKHGHFLLLRRVFQNLSI